MIAVVVKHYDLHRQSVPHHGLQLLEVHLDAAVSRDTEHLPSGSCRRAYRSGQVSIIQAQAVRENDEFSYEYGLEPKLSHKPALRDRGEVYCYYAMFRTKDGGFGFEVMSKEDIQAHAERFSQSYGSDFSPWKTSFDAMAKKTVLKQVLRYAPLKSDFVKAVASDGTIKHDIAPDMSEVPTVADYVVDGDTGEVIEVNVAEGGGPA